MAPLHQALPFRLAMIAVTAALLVAAFLAIKHTQQDFDSLYVPVTGSGPADVPVATCHVVDKLIFSKAHPPLLPCPELPVPVTYDRNGLLTIDVTAVKGTVSVQARGLDKIYRTPVEADHAGPINDETRVHLEDRQPLEDVALKVHKDPKTGRVLATAVLEHSSVELHVNASEKGGFVENVAHYRPRPEILSRSVPVPGQPNILLMAMDSLSRASAAAALSQSHAYLKKHGAFFMGKHHTNTRGTTSAAMTSFLAGARILPKSATPGRQCSRHARCRLTGFW
jgi:hypothetical protein